jgi:hypothetical protein
MSWSPPAGGGHDDYLVVRLGGGSQPAGASQTTATMLLSGPTCFVVVAMRSGAPMGNSDILCGIPGVSNL